MQVDAPAVKMRRLALTPLIDIVFLLLVFFMLASTFLQYSSIDVRSSRSGATKGEMRGAVYARVHPDGRVDVNGAAVAPDQLVSHLDALGERPDARLILRVMKDTKVQQLVAALERIRTSRIKQIIIAR